MSEYIDQLKSLIRPELPRFNLKILPRGRSSFSLVRGTEIVMTVRDAGAQVELSYMGKRYQYDKWYTKPEHLANVIFNVLSVQERKQAG